MPTASGMAVLSSRAVVVSPRDVGAQCASELEGRASPRHGAHPADTASAADPNACRIRYMPLDYTGYLNQYAVSGRQHWKWGPGGQNGGLGLSQG